MGGPLSGPKTKRAGTAALVATFSLPATRAASRGSSNVGLRPPLPSGDMESAGANSRGVRVARSVPATMVTGPDMAVAAKPDPAARTASSPMVGDTSVTTACAVVASGNAFRRASFVPATSRAPPGLGRSIETRPSVKEMLPSLAGATTVGARAVRRAVQDVVIDARQQRRLHRSGQSRPDGARVEGEAGEPVDGAGCVDGEAGLARHDLEGPVPRQADDDGRLQHLRSGPVDGGLCLVGRHAAGLHAPDADRRGQVPGRPVAEPQVGAPQDECGEDEAEHGRSVLVAAPPSGSVAAHGPSGLG